MELWIIELEKFYKKINVLNSGKNVYINDLHKVHRLYFRPFLISISDHCIKMKILLLFLLLNALGKL